MPYTQADLDAVNEVIATGARKVRFADGREHEARSLADLRSIRDEIAADLGRVPEPVRTTFASHSRD